MSKNESTESALAKAEEHDDHDHKAPGTFVLVLVLLGTFAVYYFANWKALSDVWHVRLEHRMGRDPFDVL